MSATLRRVGEFGRLSTSLVSGVFSSSSSSITPPVDPRLSVAAAETVLRSALQKIIKTLNSRKYKAVRDEAQLQLDLLESLVKEFASTAVKPDLPSVTDNSTFEAQETASPPGRLGSILQEHAAEFFSPFRMACETRSSKAILVSLDGLQKLLACGFLSCVVAQTHPKSNGQLKASLEQEVLDADDPTKQSILIDDAVNVIIGCSHGADDAIHLQMIRCLLTAVTSVQCGDLHGQSLTAAIRAVFEIFGTDRDPQNQRTAQAALTQMVNVVMRKLEHATPKKAEERSNIPTPAPLTELETPPLEDTATIPPVENGNHVVKIAKECDTEETVEEGNYGLCAVCRRPAPHFCLQTGVPLCGKECKMRNLEMIRALSDASSPGGSTDHPDAQNSQLQQDALLVLQALCKLSMQDLPPASSGTASVPADQRLVRCKRLSLELLLSMLEGSGAVFRSDERFMKDHLRTEIGVFVDQILLRILESGNSSFEHKHRVLQVFHKLCTDPHVALELYLNFDCDVEEKDVFARMVDCLAKIAQGKYTTVDRTPMILPEQQVILKQMALESLVTLMSSLLDWVKKSQEEIDAREVESILNSPLASPTCKTEAEASDMTNGSLTGAVEQSGESKSPSTTGGVVNGSRPQQTNQHELIMQQRQRKLQFQEGITTFNQKPKKGLQFLIEKGHVENSPEKIASFFLRCSGLGKQQIGEYLGEEDAFNQSVLYELVDQLEFKDLEIDFALRKFLSTFRLPGEAQKIDRMMEKFAEKYVKDNPDNFTTADCAYVLAFSLIMLHTDAHSKSIKPENKMTLELFIRNNRGINDSEDLPSEYLESLYHRIVSEEWVMEEEADRKAAMETQQQLHQLESLAVALGLTVSSSGRRKFELFLKESKGIVTKSTEMIRRRGRELTSSSGAAYVVASPDLCGQVAFLFKSVCMLLVATFSLLMKTEDSPQFVTLVLKGLKVCIQVAARFGMVPEVELYTASLAKFTGMTFSNSPSEAVLSMKNIQALQVVLEVALSEGDTLGTSWKLVLECASRLHSLMLLNSGCVDDPLLLAGPSTPNRSLRQVPPTPISVVVLPASPETTELPPRPSSSAATNPDAEIPLTFEQMNAALVSQEINMANIDLLFVRSRALSQIGIVAFVKGLCEVSKEELQGTSPRIFSLQKLVEVADCNMNRIRIIWTKIWTILREHFIEAALHRHFGVCLYAVDSIRQLAMKFLEKDELSNYAFQIEFLKPLQIVMLDSRTGENIKEFIVQSISNMIKARASNIKSGWKIVLNIINAAATTVPNGSLDQAFTRCRLALDVIALILKKYFWIAVEHFGEVVRCIVSFGLLHSSEHSMKAALPLEALMYLEGLAVVLANEDYSKYLSSKYQTCDNIILMEGGLPDVSHIEKLNESKHSEGWCGVPRGGPAENYVRILLRVKAAEARLDSVLSSEAGVQTPPLEELRVEREVRQELQQQLSGYWFPIFTGLSQLSTSAQMEMREVSLDSLFRLLIELGAKHLNGDMWQMTVKGVLFPLFDDLNLHVQQFPIQLSSHNTQLPPHNIQLPPHNIQLPPHNVDLRPVPQPPPEIGYPKVPPPPQMKEVESPEEWAGIRCRSALEHLVVLVDKQFGCVSPFLVDVLNLISSCIQGKPELVARLGIGALADLIVRVGPQFSEVEWAKMTKCLLNLFDSTAPKALMTNTQSNRPTSPKSVEFKELRPFPNSSRRGHDDGEASLFQDSSEQTPVKLETIKILPFNPQEIVTQCVVQLLLIELIQTSISPFLNSMPPSCVDQLLEILKETFSFARQFNRQVEWRHRLKCLGFMREMRQLPGLLKQEREGLATLLSLLFELVTPPLYPSTTSIDRRQFLLGTCRCVIKQYLERQVKCRSAENISNDGPKTLGQLALIEGERETSGMTPILLKVVIEGFDNLPSEPFSAMSEDIFHLLVDLTLCDAKALRIAVRNLLLSKFPPIFTSSVVTI